MATTNDEKLLIIPSLDQGVQMQSTEFLAQKSEIRKGVNIDPTYRLGGIAKSLGYSILGLELATYATSTSTSTSTTSSTSSSSTSTSTSTSSSSSSSSTSSSSTTTMA